MADGDFTVGKHVLIKGTVQGVWYRVSMQTQANALGIVGWCRNTLEGHVEAECYGSPENIESLIAWCHQGPEQARVEAVDVTDRPVSTEHVFETFEIRR